MFKIFYSCYSTGDSVDSSNPIEIEKDTLIDMSYQLLRDKQDFLGIIDKKGQTIQLIVNGEDLLMDIPIPHKKGAMVKALGINEVEPFLKDLKNPFKIRKIKNLVFEKW